MARAALIGVSFAVRPGRLLALVGPNGSGKSTLVKLLIGRHDPTSGIISRPGPAGLGEEGGTAVVFQRPESQVLGVRVRDDVCWGLSAERRPDVGALLEVVGLSGFEERETSTLSGGELQRLAIAAALARHPRVLVSDEATAMIDGPGRAEVTGLLRRLAGSGMAVVHVTHRSEESDIADEVVRLEAGHVVSGSEPPEPDAEVQPFTGPSLSPKPILRRALHPPRPRPPAAEEEPPTAAVQAVPGDTLVRVVGAGYVYAEGTPWAHRALEGLDLEIARGEGVVISGSNGSGKSTLAWLLAGLTVPTEGVVLIDGEPVAEQPTRRHRLPACEAPAAAIHGHRRRVVRCGRARGTPGLAVGRLRPRRDGTAPNRRAVWGRAAARGSCWPSRAPARPRRPGRAVRRP